MRYPKEQKVKFIDIKSKVIKENNISSEDYPYEYLSCVLGNKYIGTILWDSHCQQYVFMPTVDGFTSSMLLDIYDKTLSLMNKRVLS